MKTKCDSLLLILKQAGIPIDWATILVGLQRNLISNQEVINFAIDAVMPYPDETDKWIIPLAVASPKPSPEDHTILRLLCDIVVHGGKPIDHALEDRKWMYALLVQWLKQHEGKQLDYEADPIDMVWRLYTYEFEKSRELPELAAKMDDAHYGKANQNMEILAKFLIQQHATLMSSDFCK